MKASPAEIEQYLKTLEDTPRAILNAIQGIETGLLQTGRTRNLGQ